MKKIISGLVCILFLVGFSHSLKAGSRERQYRFWVEYTDKKGSFYSLLKPWDFLSSRALARRSKVGFAVCMEDIPVNHWYADSVASTGVRLLFNSRWMNGSMVNTTDSALANKLAHFAFVKQVTLVGIYNVRRGFAEAMPEAAADFSLLESEGEEVCLVKNKVKADETHFGYGLGWDQISMINGQALHNAGFRGKGIHIAILDAGFYRANVMQAFDSMYKGKRFLGSYDLVDGGKNVYNDDDHGTQVLSCMASNVRDIMIGTAPEASYLLIRTEDAGSETPAEEYTWLCGAELADSAGIDLISSSLGYTEFDDKRFGHHYGELNGNTTVITRAANMAWDRGMMVVNSAGNEGDGKWKFIGAPADAAGVIAVGAVDLDGDRADFSSFGPTADQRIKPDLVALGKGATIINSNGYYIHSNGTSYSAPILAGSLACYLQFIADKDPIRARKFAMISGNKFLTADNQIGHGIPDFNLAMKMATGDVKATTNSETPFMYWPDNDTISQYFEIKTIQKPKENYQYKLKNTLGFTIESGMLFPYENVLYAALIQPKDKGTYKLEISDGKEKWNCKFHYSEKEKIKHK